MFVLRPSQFGLQTSASSATAIELRRRRRPDSFATHLTGPNQGKSVLLLQFSTAEEGRLLCRLQSADTTIFNSEKRKPNSELGTSKRREFGSSSSSGSGSSSSFWRAFFLDEWRRSRRRKKKKRKRDGLDIGRGEESGKIAFFLNNSHPASTKPQPPANRPKSAS